MEHELRSKRKSLKMEKLFANITYYKLRARKHFGYYIIGLGDKGYGVSSTEEILNQAFIIPRVCRGWKTMGRNRSSWPEWACAEANAMAAPWRAPCKVTSLTRFGMLCRRTTGTTLLALTNLATCSVANRRLSSWADKSKKIQRGDDQSLEDEIVRKQSL